MLEAPTDLSRDPSEEGPIDGLTSDHQPQSLRAADPSDQTRQDTARAGPVFAVMVATLLLSALLNANTMLHRAETSELSPGRDLALSFWRPIESMGSGVGLTLPRAGFDALREADRTGNGPAKTVAGRPSDAAGVKSPPLASLDEREMALDQSLGHERMPTTETSTPSSAPPEPTTTAVVGDGATELADGSDVAGGDDPGQRAPAAPSISATPMGLAGLPPLGELRPQSDPGFALRRPSSDDPLRILIIGDSTLDAVGTSMLRDLAETGLTDGILDFRVSSGLSRPDFFDWPAYMREIRPQLDPEIVVIMLGANDAQPFVVGSTVESFGTDQWLETYRARVAALLDELTADGAWVVWIGQPIMRNPDFDIKMIRLNQVYAEEVGRYSTATYVDSRSMTIDENGEYSAYLVDANGDRTQVRQSDGIHLTSAGGDHVSPTIIEAINEIAPLY